MKFKINQYNLVILKEIDKIHSRILKLLLDDYDGLYKTLSLTTNFEWSKKIFKKYKINESR